MTVVEQLEQLTAAHADLMAEYAKAQEAISVASARVTEIETEMAAIKVKAEADAAASAKRIEDMTAEMRVEMEAHAGTKATLEKCLAALRNPAHMDAAIIGLVKPTAEGETPEAAAPERIKTKDELLAEYNALPDGIQGARLRAEFRAKHKEALGL